jgi:hypothetical protein
VMASAVMISGGSSFFPLPKKTDFQARFPHGTHKILFRDTGVRSVGVR